MRTLIIMKKSDYNKEDMLRSISLKKAEMETIENDITNIAWNRLEEITHHEHDSLTAKEQFKVHEESIERHRDYSIPVFILGLESKYTPASIAWFMFDILGVDCVVDSIKKRTGRVEDKTVYDVHLWANDSDFLKILMWDDLFPEIVNRNLAITDLSIGFREYLLFLQPEFFTRGEKLMEYSLTNVKDQDQNDMDALIQRYCHEPETVKAVLA